MRHNRAYRQFNPVKIQTVWLLACFADVISSRLVKSAKQRRYPCSGSPADSMNYRKCVSNFPSTWLANLQSLFFKLANHGAYLNSGTYRWGPRTTPERESRRCFGNGLYQNGLDSSLTQAVWLPVLSVKS